MGKATDPRMLRLFALCSLLAFAQSLQLPTKAQSSQSTTRRGALAAAGAALSVRVLPASAAIQDPVNSLSNKAPSAAVKEVLSTQEALTAFVKSEAAFVEGTVDGDASAPQLPRAIPFTTFQALEKDAGPEFMEIAIDYAEAMRNARAPSRRPSGRASRSTRPSSCCRRKSSSRRRRLVEPP